MVTSHDVAKHAGVSQSTVSRVLNNNGKVAPDIRTRVLASLEATGYVPNAQAKAMRTSRAGAIGIVTSEIQNPFFPYMLEEITRVARTRNLNVLVWNDSNPDVPMASAGIASGAVDGVLFMAAKEGTRGIAAISRRGFPVLLCNRGPDDATTDVVTSDHYHSGYMAANYFLENGRENMAAVFGPDDTFASPARARGFRAALAEAGVKLRDGRTFSGPTAYETGVEAMTQLLNSPDLPDAVFCSSDIIAYGAMDTLRGAGLSIPDDLWVVGIDGLPMSGWRSFDLTTQRQRVDSIAEAAVDTILERIGGGVHGYRRITIPTEWVVRASSDAAPVGTRSI